MACGWPIDPSSSNLTCNVIRTNTILEEKEEIFGALVKFRGKEGEGHKDAKIACFIIWEGAKLRM